MGPKHGVCRNFAVLGFCDQGLDCEHQHVRECPDFAESGQCLIKGCKLPHVIRANRNRKPVQAATIHTLDEKSCSGAADGANLETSKSSGITDTLQQTSRADTQLGDEYISLTFNESDESDEEEGDDDDDESDDGDDGDSSAENSGANNGDGEVEVAST
jgi:hypothetical protein